MTFEEIQKTLEQMLAVQRELQEGQLKTQERQNRDREEFRETIEQMLSVQRDLQERQNRDRETFRETIQQMLSVQRDLQERQLRLEDMQERERETIQILVEEMKKLIEISNRNERRIEQLIGYSITNESEHLDIEERFRALEQRLQRLEEDR